MCNEKNKFNVCLFGASLDVGNQGCHALAVSLIKLVLDLKSFVRVDLLYGNRNPDTKILEISGKKIKVNIVNSRLSPKSKINEHLFWILLMAFFYRFLPFKTVRNLTSKFTPWIRVLEQADFVGDIRGGDSFSDIYGLQRIIFGSAPCITAILMKKKLILLPQTYGPYNSKIAEYIARFIMKHSPKIYARDKDSLKLARNLLGSEKKNKFIKFCPDVAFTMESIKPNEVDISPSLNNDSSKPLIGLNISGLLYNGGYTRNNMFGLKFEYKEFINMLIYQLMEKTDAHVLLVPHVFSIGLESDYDASCKVLESLEKKYSNRIHLVMHEYNQNEIKWIIGLCDFFIGSRMHSCIAALSQKIPSVGIAYGKKFLGVFESIGLVKNVIDAREQNQNDIITECINHFRNRYNDKNSLEENIPKIQSEIRRCFKEEILNTHMN